MTTLATNFYASRPGGGQQRSKRPLTVVKPDRPPAHMNILLVKSEIGRARPAVYDLPGPEHVYGCTVMRGSGGGGSGGAAAAVRKAQARAGAGAGSAAEDSRTKGQRGVKQSQEDEKVVAVAHISLRGRQNSRLPTDYVGMNRKAAKEGVVTPAQAAEYRRTHPRIVKLSGARKAALERASQAGKGAGGSTAAAAALQTVAGPALIQLKSKGRLPSDANAHFVYGKPTRPSTPVSKLVSDVYIKQWLAEKQAKADAETRAERERQLQQQRRRPKLLTVQQKQQLEQQQDGNNNIIGAPGTSKDRILPLAFKLKRFEAIGPKVVTTREKAPSSNRETLDNSATNAENLTTTASASKAVTNAATTAALAAVDATGAVKAVPRRNDPPELSVVSAPAGIHLNPASVVVSKVKIHEEPIAHRVVGASEVQQIQIHGATTEARAAGDFGTSVQIERNPANGQVVGVQAVARA